MSNEKALAGVTLYFDGEDRCGEDATFRFFRNAVPAAPAGSTERGNGKKEEGRTKATSVKHDACRHASLVTTTSNKHMPPILARRHTRIRNKQRHSRHVPAAKEGEVIGDLMEFEEEEEEPGVEIVHAQWCWRHKFVSSSEGPQNGKNTH